MEERGSQVLNGRKWFLPLRISQICSCTRQVWPWQKFAKLVRQAGRCRCRCCYVSAVLESGPKTNKRDGRRLIKTRLHKRSRPRVSFGQLRWGWSCLVLETKWKIDACRSYKERDAVDNGGFLQIGRLVVKLLTFDLMSSFRDCAPR